MTNEEITKGLEICSHPYNNRYTCGDCPYYDTKNCIGVLLSDARNRIIEQEQEFKQLETNAEILARGVRDLNHENYKLTEKIKQAKTDVLNELEAHIQNAIDAYWDSDGARGYCHADNVIVDIEEMIEELKK